MTLGWKYRPVFRQLPYPSIEAPNRVGDINEPSDLLRVWNCYPSQEMTPGRQLD